jgi:2-polyprenyl-6-methoxyphenol hydroxylase-like FAD-dependent oxidoreductase
MARHAIVLGGSMAGLLAARALSDHFERVTVVERDRFPDEPAPRRGLPQSRHLHIVLTRGRRELERLFPQLGADLDAAGALTFDYGRGATIFFRDGPLARFDSELVVRACTRPLLDWHIRRYVQALRGVSFLEERSAAGLVLGAGGGAVAGVRLMDGDREDVLDCDLVVDACGRQSRAAAWLGELGYDPPDETVIDSTLSYACRMYAPKPGAQAGWRLLSTMPRAPDFPRSGAIFAVEGDRWIVCLASMGDDQPPLDHEGFLDFARSLPSPALYESLCQAEPVGPAARSGSTENRLRHYERLRRFPDGLALVGDSVCALNPIYGQGITSAALGARLLCDEVARRADLRGLGRRFQRRLAKLNEAAWMISIGGDAAWPQTRGLREAGAVGRFLAGWPGRLFRAYGDLLIEAAARRPNIARVLMEVMHMVRPSNAIMTPGMFLRVLSHRLFGGASRPRARAA